MGFEGVEGVEGQGAHGAEGLLHLYCEMVRTSWE